ncbi:MAG: hypothetical protein M1603_02305 [Candidatus Marsarchaeota archaeon]|jgi:hypothetical protein|nr:hypothetical protein [Candidatus Marsarchaeota archaeon]
MPDGKQPLLAPHKSAHACARGFRAQEALDFMLSYGVAILIIAIAIYVVAQLGAFNPSIAPVSCTPSPGFACISYAIDTDGTLIATISQATGGTMTIVGAACSSSVNATGNKPEYGNIGVLGWSSAPSYYPAGISSGAITSYSGGSFLIEVRCYNGAGIASGNLGNVFTGYLWLNYTFSGLPSSIYHVNNIATFTAKYT